ncbi:hypothetical protein [Streptomyces sp. NPDC053720]|uniref:hypothetical protein n=1 Tax=Streptomyces sp. NPDC053720 TaxID=3154855 RepID=UPI0034363CFF
MTPQSEGPGTTSPPLTRRATRLEHNGPPPVIEEAISRLVIEKRPSRGPPCRLFGRMLLAWTGPRLTPAKWMHDENDRMGAMDSGLAALLGAAVGAATTLGAAVVNGRAQERSQHAHWSRQHRRDAYAGYLSALHDRDIAMDAVLDALRSDSPDLPDIDEKTGRFISLAREVHRATEVVILEGPASLATVTERVAHASSDLSHIMRRMTENARAGDTTHKAEDTAFAAERERILYQTVKDFRLAARSAIGGTD